MSEQLTHDTISISKTIKATVEQVFAAWEDPNARTIWGPPSDDEAIEFVENDFRVGGIDVHLCGQKDDLRFQVETRYYEINSPNLLIFTECVKSENAPLSTSLITVAIAGNGSLTELSVTIQIASLVGSDMIKGTRSGWQIAISNLAAHLETSTRETQ
ncbi:SRPBCC family protein [Microbulbifer spongiae]|uniref:SRPBCC family protein n=1 Tax=Microbulbifer spongiae TaxID=2944933 RepID=A0ABY9EBJ7_9GAMM|nr:SRPBCC family protein [Microbulbifer sp. MI-G]WKD49667.1 SRPBCC family protein [Microbulbifer sp. MI-G]